MKKLTALLLVLLMTVSLVACTGGKGKNDGQTTLSIGIVKKTNVESYEDNEFTKWLEEQTGYKIEFVYFSSDASEAITQITAMMSGGEELPDILWGINGSLTSDWGQDGYVIDLAPYFNDKEKSSIFWSRMDEVLNDGQKATLMQSMPNATTGANYFMPMYEVGGTDNIAAQAYINKTWLDNLGLEIPTTYEELVNVLRHFRDDDPNGNGKADEIPMIGGVGLYRANIVQWLINNWVYLNDSYYYDIEDGQLYYPQVTEEYREALRALKSLVDEGLLSPLSWTVAQTSELKALVTPEDNVAIAGVIGMHCSVHIGTDSPLLYEYVPLPPFNYAPMMMDQLRSTVCITENCKNPDAAFKLLQTMYTEEGGLRMHYGVPDVDWTYATDDDGNRGILILNADAYSGQTRQTWSFMDCTIINFQEYPYKTVVAAGSEPTWSNDLSALSRSQYAAYTAVANANNPKEIVYKLSYTAEEVEENGDITSNLKSYISSTRAEFINGTKDLDTDWDEYVQAFYALGAETLLKNAQTAYDRTK